MFYKNWKQKGSPRIDLNVEIGSYHGDLSHISSSWLKEAGRSMARFASYPDKPITDPTLAQKVGTIFHTLLLEGELFDKSYHVLKQSELPFPDSTMAKKENKAYVDKIVASGKEVVSSDLFDGISEMKKSVLSSAMVRKYLDAGVKEASIYWWDEETGLPLKTRPDLYVVLGDNSAIVLDVKTTENSSPSEFSSSAAKYDYPLQAAMQIDGMESIGHNVVDYFYLAVEKSYPYDFCIYRLTEDDISAGRARYKNFLSEIKSCMGKALEEGESYRWPGVGRTQIERKMLDENTLDIIDMVLPSYYYGK